MADALAKQDIMALARLARASLVQWLDALDNLPDNPVFRLIRAKPRRRAAQTWAIRAWDYLPPATSAAILVYLGASHQLALLQTRIDPVVLALLSAAILLFTTWLISGWCNVAYSALTLVSEPGSLGRGEIQLDEGILATGITEHELVLGMMLGVGGRALSRLLAAAAAVPVGLWLAATFGTGQEQPVLSVSLAQIMSANSAYGTRVLVYAVMSTAFLALLSLPGGIVMLLWLMSLGRNLQQRWQMQVIAFSLSLAQVVWIPLALFQVFHWLGYINTYTLADDVDLTNALAPLALFALLVALLVLSQRLPASRTVTASILPWLVIACAVISTLNKLAEMRSQQFVGSCDVLYSLTWLVSSMTLVNPLTLPFREWLGISPDCPLVLRAFDWYRLPGILLMQVALIAICAAAARQAVRAWRQHEH